MKQAPQELLQKIAELEDLKRFKKYNRLSFIDPYPKQKEFFAAGKNAHERLLMAPNQVGKTEAGAMEMAIHLTGLYPDWWEGAVFARPVRCWAVGESGRMVRDTAQEKLFGKSTIEADFGSGWVPKGTLKWRPSLSHGNTGLYDTLQVEHKTNGVVDGVSSISFLTYEQGREKFQGATMDVIWLDEEPPDEVFSECLTRIGERPATGRRGLESGIMYMTFTPFENAGSVVKTYIQSENPDRVKLSMSLEDSLHITKEERKRRWDRYPPHEREARYFGRPGQGSGAVFSILPNAITIDPIEYKDIPLSWRKVWGLDFGIAHPSAAVLIAHDLDTDCIYVLRALRFPDGVLPPMQVAAIKAVAGNTICAWPADGGTRESDGVPLIQKYKECGLRVCPSHATHSDGSVSTEAGILEMQVRMATERFKVFSTEKLWFEEFMSYHRKDALIVKKDDDIMSATRIAVMMRRVAQPGPIGPSMFDSRKWQTSNKEINSDAAISARIDYPLF